MYIHPLSQFSKSAGDDPKTEGIFKHYVLFLAVLSMAGTFLQPTKSFVHNTIYKI